jgi:hypothetical protein
MRDLRLLIEGTSPLDCARAGLSVSRRPVLALAGEGNRRTWKRVPLKAVDADVYGKLVRRRRKAQMAARRELGVRDDVRR